MSTTKTTSVAEAAAKLAGNPEIAANVERRIAESRMVMRLIHLRIDKKLTQKDIAAHMRCSASRISKLESGVDADLAWSDIMGYLGATKTGMSIVLDDPNLPAAMKIKHHVYEIDALLKQLVNLAGQNVGKEIVDKIHQFSGEVLMNFLWRFGDNYENLQTIVKMCDEADEGNTSITPTEVAVTPRLVPQQSCNK